MARFYAILGAVLLGSLSAASPAIATTTVATGTFSGGDTVLTGGTLPLPLGKSIVSLTFTGSITDFDGGAHETISTNDWCDFNDGNGQVYCGGDDVDILPIFEQVGPNRYQFMLTVNPDTDVITPGYGVVRETTSSDCCTYEFEFTGVNSGSWLLSFATVPEPSTWAMMLLGFGAIGFAARRRNQRAMLATA